MRTYFNLCIQLSDSEYIQLHILQSSAPVGNFTWNLAELALISGNPTPTPTHPPGKVYLMFAKFICVKIIPVFKKIMPVKYALKKLRIILRNSKDFFKLAKNVFRCQFYGLKKLLFINITFISSSTISLWYGRLVSSLIWLIYVLILKNLTKNGEQIFWERNFFSNHLNICWSNEFVFKTFALVLKASQTVCF